MKNPIRLISITYGADFEIDLSCFSEPEPMFAYVDDVGTKVKLLKGLVEAGRLMIDNQSDYMWLHGPRDCVLLKACEDHRDGQFASFRSLGVGEFCLQIYHVCPEKSVVLLHQNDFCFK